MFEEGLKVLFNKKITSDTYCLGLEAPEIARTAKSGQFVMMRTGSGYDPLLRRPFSIAGITGDTVHILYRVVGKGTAIMAGILEGHVLDVLGPLGKGFVADEREGKCLLVGGGIGVAPLYFLCSTLEGKDVEFLMGFRTSQESFVYEPLAGKGFRVSVATDDGSEGYPGPVTGLLERFLEGTKGGSVSVFACGPKAMLRRIAALCRSSKIPCQVSLETTMGCGLGACLGCAVEASSRERKRYLYACKDGPVFSADSIDWTAF